MARAARGNPTSGNELIHGLENAMQCPLGRRSFCASLGRSYLIIAGMVVTALGLPKPGAAQQREHPLAPDAALAMFELADGYELQLLAAEPLVVDPVEAAIDDLGRMWVVEMRDYPFQTDEHPRGQIRVLLDQDADGVYDQSLVFAAGLDMPTGLGIWQNGVVVTLAGQLVNLQDTDGDLRADRSEVWLEGFAAENEQLRANHPRLGPDGWWYIANGLRGGSLRRGKSDRHAASHAHLPSDKTQPGKTQPSAGESSAGESSAGESSAGESSAGESSAADVWQLGNKDVRIEPHSQRVELLSGGAQFGLSFDAVGGRYFCSNRNPAIQEILPQGTLEGNPLLGLVSPVHDVVPSGESSRVFPLVEAWTTSNLHAGQYTAACGVAVRSLLRSDGGLQHELLCCEPTGSLIQRYLTTGNAPSEQAAGAPAGRAWLASRDPWFRPVNISPSPDGGWLIVDMHRAVIEHPQWVPEELKQRIDERWGNQAGRIYRVRQRSSQPATQPAVNNNALPNGSSIEQPLRNRSPGEWIKLVGTGNDWLRQQAARLLIERAAVDAAQPLIEQAFDPAIPLLGRIASLQCGFAVAPPHGEFPRVFDTPFYDALLQSPAGRVPTELQIAGLNLLRQRASPSDGERQAVIMHCVAAVAAGERKQASELSLAAWICLGEMQRKHASSQFAAGAERNRDAATELSRPLLEAAAEVATWDAYHAMAAAAVTRQQPAEMLKRWVEQLGSASDAATSHNMGLTPQQVAAAARGWSAAVNTRVAKLADAGVVGEVEPPVWARLVQFDTLVPGSLQQLAAMSALRQWWQQQPEQAQTKMDHLFWHKLAGTVVDLLEVARAGTIGKQQERSEGRTPSSATEAVAHAAIDLLALSPDPAATIQLRDLTLGAVRLDCWPQLVEGWSQRNDPACDRYLTEQLQAGGPSTRLLATRLLANSPRGLEEVAGALSDGRLTAAQLGPAALQLLSSAARGESAEVLREQLTRLVDSDRQDVVRRYSDCLMLPGKVARGKQLFRDHCAACHRIDGVGFEVGPDISDSRTQLPQQLLSSILDPNAAIDNGYLRVVALTYDQQIVEGIVAEETTDAIVIRSPEAKRTRIARQDIEDWKTSGVSLMPEGFEAQLDLQAMADLIAYIKGWRYADNTSGPLIGQREEGGDE